MSFSPQRSFHPALLVLFVGAPGAVAPQPRSHPARPPAQVTADLSAPPSRRSAETSHAGEDPLESLRAGLADRSPRTRRGAVRAAAAAGSRAAWDLVVEALADRESEVADEAQLQLGELANPRVLADLLGARGLRSPAAGVRERVAEALGRMPLQLDAGALARQVSTRPPDLEFTRLLMWTLERQASARRLTGDVRRATRSLISVAESRRDPRLRGDALLALSVLDPEGTPERLREAVGAREPELRCAALVAAARSRSPRLGPGADSGGGLPALPWARTLIDDPRPAVRLAALDTLEAIGSRDSLHLLVERLASEPALRLRWRALQILRSQSGMKYRFDPRSWQRWLEQQDPAWRPLAARPRVTAEASRARGLSSFPVHSERVAFLFDFSGSMWTEDAEGRTPKDVIEVELRRALEALPEETRFNLIPFTYAPLPWRPALVPATSRNIQGALKFFEGCNARGRGNFYDAALLALADPEVDTLVVLTDGVPTGGTHNLLDLVVPLLLHQNRLRGVTIEALLVGAPHGVRRRWEELARATGGSAVPVQLDGL